MNRPARSLGKAAWRQIALITLAALALYWGVRRLPTGTNLSHMDFRVTGGNSIEFCDPSNPQFIPVIAVRSPVRMDLAPENPRVEAGRETAFRLTLATASGKAIAAADLLYVHTRRLHLLVVDPTLADYQHVHPEPGNRPGEWTFSFTPRLAGNYRVFADFTPAATGRGLYASADVNVATGEAAPTARGGDRAAGWVVEQDGCQFELRPTGGNIRAGQGADLKFAITRPGGGEVLLAPVMDAYAHLVAFDEARSGFAHLHPTETDLVKKPDGMHPVLTFRITIPQPGRYVIWAQVNLNGREVYVPFWFEVVP